MAVQSMMIRQATCSFLLAGGLLSSSSCQRSETGSFVNEPVIVNRIPSIQARVVDKDRDGYTLLLRNVSSRGIVSYSIAESPDSSLTADSHQRTLMPPGGTRTARIEHTTRKLVVTAALFTDGSHEGDSDAAAQLKSGQISYEIQEGRALPIIDRIVKAPSINDEIRLAQIKDELSRLSNEPDHKTIQQMRSQFPDLSPDVVRKDLTNALYSARVNLWSELYGYMHSSGEYPPPDHPPPLAEWLRRRK
jgi:hypothetical protein